MLQNDDVPFEWKKNENLLKPLKEANNNHSYLNGVRFSHCCKSAKDQEIIKASADKQPSQLQKIAR